MTDFHRAERRNGPGPSPGRMLERPAGRIDFRPRAVTGPSDLTAPGPNPQTAQGRDSERPRAETRDGPRAVDLDGPGPNDRTAPGPTDPTAQGRTGPNQLSARGPESGRTGRRPRAVTSIGPVSILDLDGGLALGYLPGVYPYGTWRYDSERHTLYSGHYFATYEEARLDLAKRSHG